MESPGDAQGEDWVLSGSRAKRDLLGSGRRHGSEQQPAALRPGPGLPPGEEHLLVNPDLYAALSLQCFIETVHWALVGLTVGSLGSVLGG